MNLDMSNEESTDKVGFEFPQHALTDEALELQDLSYNESGDLPESTESARRREEWVLLRHSNIFKRILYRIWYGPDKPNDEPPAFPRKFELLRKIDAFPEDVFKSRFPKKSVRIFLLLIYGCVWFGIVSSLIHAYLIKKPFFYPSDGGEKLPIITLSCNSYLNWEGKNNACGLMGELCEPFDNKEYYIRCPALCDRGGWTYSAIDVGTTKVKYRGYEIGGGQLSDSSQPDLFSYPYRADSFACGAAVHADIISPTRGGCARISMEGFQTLFPSREGKHNTKFSVGFNSFFPSSFAFRSYLNGIASGCHDPRMTVVCLNILFGLPIFYLYESIIGYWICTIVGYWTLVLVLDPPLLVDPHDESTVYELFSLGFQRLLPLCFVLYVLWKSAVKRTLKEDCSPLCKILLWYPLLWLGIMNNITFDRLPVDRLTGKDLKEQAGAATAVGCIAGTILTCAFIQAYSLWKSGRFRKFFKIYISFILGLVSLASIPGLHLRIHHYILGAVLVPGCATRGTSAYMFQGILIGLVLSGVSRWDFASIVETDIALLRGEAGAAPPPPIFRFKEETPHTLHLVVNSTASESYIRNEELNGFSLLLNDIEVYIGKDKTIDLDELFETNENLSLMAERAIEESANGSIPLYLRAARVSMGSPQKDRSDYTNAAILEWPVGIWHDPLLGVS
ncbi:uncharacterized protein KNAG_0C04270 [Huiozyma naganishii CBS 8797]|uniref:LCCL domain-containing protein n=1 Tax=Huiozyma naganishii (strain ATCC MYA-139 / BCRC 22969 / CBS 8797 / KCTC 17520 / NBRC 10181 / NCYC 3082 / Yp74L-3) TaxID=1071383 RepID=J7S4Y0_HUIN7|nr:hypothetical protein KNAG_0C04270 [Kazachstania naganishii CBS 8797]CCK69529.1 hypothetical protein KNAG_0C04270 [Kazachstania naganishii CBS 8797]